MIIVPNHHVIVPHTRDLYFYMPNKITTVDGTRRGAQVRRAVGPYINYVEVNFDIKSLDRKSVV